MRTNFTRDFEASPEICTEFAQNSARTPRSKMTPKKTTTRRGLSQLPAPVPRQWLANGRSVYVGSRQPRGKRVLLRTARRKIPGFDRIAGGESDRHAAATVKAKDIFISYKMEALQTAGNRKTISRLPGRTGSLFCLLREDGGHPRFRGCRRVHNSVSLLKTVSISLNTILLSFVA